MIRPRIGRFDRALWQSTVHQLLRACALVIGTALLVWAAWRLHPAVVLENHLVEWSQALLLMLSGCVHLARAHTGQDHTEYAAIHGGLGFVALAMSLRELDIDRFGTSAFWPLTEMTLRAALALACLVFVRKIWQDWGQRIIYLSSLVLQPTMMLIGAGLLLYVASQAFDQQWIILSTQRSLLAEECLQICGAVFVFMSAVGRDPHASWATAPSGMEITHR